jgi:hypothetical protein
LILGVCSLIVSIILFAVYSIVGAAESLSGIGCGSGAGSPPCSANLLEVIFLVPGLILLGLGLVAIIVVLHDVW